jgi:hypothetical protein
VSTGDFNWTGTTLNLYAEDDIAITAGGDLVFAAVNGDITSNSGDITLIAENDIRLAATGQINAEYGTLTLQSNSGTITLGSMTTQALHLVINATPPPDNGGSNPSGGGGIIIVGDNTGGIPEISDGGGGVEETTGNTPDVTPGGGAIIIDSDNDGLPDDWEQTAFQSLDQQAHDDPDGDGYSNSQELERGMDPDLYMIHLKAGWNLVALARMPADNSVAAIFGQQINGQVWRWHDGSFLPVASLEPLQGYWVRAKTAVDIHITLTP